MNLKNSKIALFVFSLGAVALVGCNNKPVTSKVTITFDGNGGTVIPANDETSTTLEVNKGTVWKDITNKPTAKKDDYAFNNVWTTTKDDQSTGVSDTFVFNENTTLYAYYDEIKFTYKFVDGDKTIKEETIKKGAVIVAPEDLDDKHAQDTDEKYYHFSFDGWYDGETKFVIGTTISKDVTYTSKFTKGNEITHLDGEVPTCSEPGYKEAYMCEDCYPVETYYDVPDSIADEHLIGDIDEYNAWIKEGGDGYLEPTGEHDYEPVLKGTYKQTYTALEEFNSQGLEVWLHCSYEPEEDDTNDVEITNYQVEYEATDKKLHVNNGGASVTFTYDGVDYEEDLPLTIAPISVDEPAAGTNSFTYTGSVITYTVATSDRYTISNNTATDVGNYNATIALTDKGGDYVWKTSGTTADLTYAFTITKGTNAISGLVDSYTTTCHTAPTISGVTSTWGTVQYDYWKKVGTGEETQVKVSEIEKATNTTYRVRAFVPATDNYDLVEQYVTLNVEHNWGEAYAPTDHIGRKMHECVCGAVEEVADSKMADADIDLSKNLYGASVEVVSSASGGCQVTNTGGIIRYDFGIQGGGAVASGDKFKFELPKVNYSLYDTGVRFDMTHWSWEYFGFTNNTNDMLFSNKDYQRMSLVVLKHGSSSPTYEAILRIFDDDGGAAVVYDDTKTIQEIRTNITDSDVINGTKGLTLYEQLGTANFRYLNLNKISLVDETCAHDRYVTSTDCVGKYVCEICGSESEDEIMQEIPIDRKITYSASVKSLDQTPKDCSVQFNIFNDGINYIEYSLSKTNPAVGDRYELEFPHINYSLYENGVVFEFNKCDSWNNIGLDEQHLFLEENDYNKHTITVLHSGDNELKVTFRAFGKTDDTIVIYENSKTIVDTDIINGLKGIPFYSKLHTTNSRNIRINKISIIQSSHDHHYITNADKIGYKVCDICGEVGTSIMGTSDVRLSNLYSSYNTCSYTGTTATVESVRTASPAMYNIKYTCHEPATTYGIYNLGIPLVNYSLYNEVVFTFTCNGWTKIRLCDDTTHDIVVGGRTSFTITVTKQSDDTYQAKLYVPAGDSREAAEDVITLTDDVAQGTSNLVIYCQHQEYQGSDRTVNLTNVVLTIPE